MGRQIAKLEKSRQHLPKEGWSPALSPARAQHGTQLKGQFLLDRDGIVRWVNIEGGKEGPSGLGKFPSEAELLTAVKALG